MISTEQSLYVVIGMPGSGKTTYLERAQAEHVVDCYFDDYQKGAPKADGLESRAKSEPRLSPTYPKLVAAMAAGQNVAIADIRYCVPEEETLIREFAMAEFPEAKVVLVYFANNPDACRHNVMLRNRAADRVKIELETIDLLTSRYNPPQNQALPVIMG